MSNLNRTIVNLRLLLADPLTKYFRMPFDGYISEVGLAANVAPDGNNAVAVSVNGQAVTGLSFALTTGNTAGTTRVAKPTTSALIRRGSTVSVATDGGGAAGEVELAFLLTQA